MTWDAVRISMLHCAPGFDDIEHNVHMLEELVREASRFMPDLIVTPELALSGYGFAQAMGTAWIEKRMPHILERFGRLASEVGSALVLGCPRLDIHSGRLYNTAILYDERGTIRGFQDKLSVLPGSEGWASPGKGIGPVAWRDSRIGLLICADAYAGEMSATLAEQGADVLISPAAWAPGMHEPDGEWEQRSGETGLSVLVCNRTGADRTMNFDGSASVVACDGARVLVYAGKRPAILSFVVDAKWRPFANSWAIDKL